MAPEPANREQSQQVADVKTPPTTLPPELIPNCERLLTEVDAPIVNVFCDKQQRLLVDALYTSWQRPRAPNRFLAGANVAVYYALKQEPLVPNVLISLNIDLPQDWWDKQCRSYTYWEYGKAPDVALEIVSNKNDRKEAEKLRLYERGGLLYHILFDPLRQLSNDIVRVLFRPHLKFIPHPSWVLPEIDLQLTLWEGEFEGVCTQWLRWCDAKGNLLLCSRERVAIEQQQAAAATARAERLAAQLLAAGIEPVQ